MRTIRIEQGNTSTGQLTLSDRGHTKAFKGEKVRWEVEATATSVQSITAIIPKNGTTDIFGGRGGSLPGQEDEKKWKAKIADNVSVGDEYRYSIGWKDSNNNPQVYDPIISIKPTPISPALGIAIIAGVAVAATIYMLLLSKKKSIKFWHR